MTELLYSPKIKPEQLARKAIVYLRQSSEKQVRYNLESQRLQLQRRPATPTSTRIPIGQARALFQSRHADADGISGVENPPRSRIPPRPRQIRPNVRRVL